MSEIRDQLRQLDKEQLIDLVLEVRGVMVQQEARIQALEDQLAKTSRNSGKPPSSDGLKKKPKSLREKGQRKSGGQIGHQGETLKMVAEPDHIKVHEVRHCPACGEDLQAVAVERELAGDRGAVEALVGVVDQEVEDGPGGRVVDGAVEGRGRLDLVRRELPHRLFPGKRTRFGAPKLRGGRRHR